MLHHGGLTCHDAAKVVNPFFDHDDSVPHWGGKKSVIQFMEAQRNEDAKCVFEDVLDIVLQGNGD